MRKGSCGRKLTVFSTSTVCQNCAIITQIILQLAQQNASSLHFLEPFVYFCKYLARIAPQYLARFVRASYYRFPETTNLQADFLKKLDLSCHLCITGLAAFYSMSREKHCA